MSTANKWLVFLLVIFTLVMFFVAMMVLNIQSKWRGVVDKLESQHEQLEEQHDRLVRGGAGEPGVQELRHDVAMYLANRGRAWYDVMPEQADPQTGEVRVGQLPADNGISENLVVYLFQEPVTAEDSTKQKGAYLGRFEVTGIAEGKVVLSPQPKLLERQLKQLAASPGPWSMYDLMPKDRRDIFADMSEDEIKALLPDESEQEYLADGKPFDAEHQPPDRRDEQGNYVRALRDYDDLFAQMHRLYVAQTDAVASAQADLEGVQAAVKESHVQKDFMDKTITSLTAELAEARRQLDAVVAHKTDVESRLAATEAAIEQLQAENQRLAGAWIKQQLEELARIEQASQTAASTP